MPLITKIEEYRPYMPLTYSTKLSNLPNIDVAERNFIVPIIGDQLYNILVQSYEGDALNPLQLSLVKKCRGVIAPFAYSLSLPFAQVDLTNAGMITIEGENTRKPFKWEYNEISNALMNMGYAAQEALILFMLNHWADFPQWEDSPYNEPSGFAIIRNGFDFFEGLSIQEPHRCYMVLKPLFDMIGELYIEENLGTAYYNALSTRIITGTVAVIEKPILKLLRQASARLVMRQAALENSIKFGADSGFTIVDARIKDVVNEGKTSPSEIRYDKYCEAMYDAAFKQIEKAVDLLNKSASPTVLSEYYNSDKYSDPNKLPGIKDNNNKHKNFVAP